ncbi:MAG TPA: hypothetical protein VF174_09590 [Micromonosporaceae bacterium]
MPPAKKEQPSLVDQLAEDAVPTEYPEGAPELLPFLQLRPRSRRAAFKRQYAEVIDLQKEVTSRSKGVTEKSSPSAQMRLAADLDDLYEQIDQLMQLAAVDEAAYRKWADEVDDETLLVTFNVYAARSQPGEASSSAS